MPSVTVQLIYTPRPEGESVAVCEGMRVYRHGDSVFILDEGSGLYGTDQHIEVPIAEALALARALALVAGCADEHWRGFHWRAEEANSNELGETPLGRWYVNREDCEKAVRTLFRSRGTTWQFVSEDGGHESDFLSPRVDDTARPTIKPELTVEPNGVYVAGPMTGLPDYNYPAFHAAAAELRSRGMVVANPAEHFDGDQTLPYGVYIREAVRSLIGCAEVVTLPGWENSKGARLEVDIAEKIGMPVTTLAEKLAADDTPEADQ